jgi:hypothetical protein
VIAHVLPCHLDDVLLLIVSVLSNPDVALASMRALVRQVMA